MTDTLRETPDKTNPEARAARATEAMAEELYFGYIYLRRNEGTPVGEFKFIVSRESGEGVQIGTPVAAETTEGTVVGVVTDMRTYGDDAEPVTSNLVGDNVMSKMDEAMVATVQVFHSDALRPVRPGRVRAASREEILKATGYDRMDYPIPAGCVRAGNGDMVAVYYDGKALLGPEAAHLMVSGLSGQAAKTSYMGVLMASALKQSPAETGETVAALVFNVKGEDMLFLDREPEAGYELDEEDESMYAALGIKPEPFGDVTVYAPPLPGTRETSSARGGDTQVLAWDLADVWHYLGYLVNTEEDEKLAAFLAEYYEQFIASADPMKAGFKTFAGLDRYLADLLTPNEEGEVEWKNHHPMTLRRIKRMLGALPSRCRGLVTRETSKPGDDIPTDQWRHGQVIVVDIAGLRPEVQGLVIARTCERMLREAEEGDLGVDHLIIMTDELNVFAPQGATQHRNVRRILQRVSTQGRYAGISLFGAAQKLSKVDELTRDNAATRAMGITPDAELASGVYGRMPAGLAEQLATLKRGEMAISHHSFRAPLVVRFPRPAWRTGRAKTRNIKPNLHSVLGLSEKHYARLTEGLTEEAANEIIAGAANPEEARKRLEAARRPDMKRVAIHEPYQTDPDDPYGEEPNWGADPSWEEPAGDEADSPFALD